MNRNIDIQLLRTFRTVAATGNMTQSSALLNLTQGAVSQQVRRLEDQLGCQLFKRQKDGMHLTAEGDRLFARSQDLIRLNDQIWNDMTEPEFKGELTLGVPLDLVEGSLPQTLRLFADQFPDVNITLIAAPTLELQRHFQDGKLDITLMEELPSALTGETLFKDQLVWIAARGSKIRQQNPLPLSIASNDCVFRLPTITALDQAGRKWKRVYESNNIDAVQAMIQMDMAVGIFLKTLVPPKLDWFKSGDGFPVLPEFHITLSVAESRQKDLANHLADFIRRGFTLKQAA
ncbi:LysR family transcriptional regulator [Sneathiella limimaris]|uniref:LysR family transcriptional regulator n=1 Tax=Sneathiella limimaris TaxID=1964213 RepID=UPI00146DAD37|nr:LysR family transcriptional regulator [Sneathiella limimaris]